VLCRDCGRVRTEQVAWTRPGARHSADFEDVVGWPAQGMDKTSVSRLMRCTSY
jgi:transposase